MDELTDRWERCVAPRPADGHRSYGVDVSEAGEALAEATMRDDGTTHLTVVWLPADDST